MSLNEEIIGTTTKIGHLEIAQYDFPEEMDWYNANKICSELGLGWRLPTIEELFEIRENKEVIGGFNKYSYWSFDDESLGRAYFLRFGDGFKGSDDMNEELYFVRAVKTTS